MSKVLEKAVKQLNDALEVIQQETNLLGFDIDSMERKEFHLRDSDFNRLFEGRIVCLESRDSKKYPYQKYVIVGGFKFLCLLKSLEECA